MPKNVLELDVRFDARRLSAHLIGLERDVIPPALSSAINKVANQAKTQAARRISAAKSIPVRVIRKRISTWHKATKESPFVLLRLRTRGVLAHEVGKPRQMKAGAAAGRYRFPGAFVANSPYFGVPVVYKRAGKARLPIRWQSVPILPEAAYHMKAAVSDTVRTKFHDVFTHELNYRLTKSALMRKYRW